jgi:cellobiose phosphorylase
VVRNENQAQAIDQVSMGNGITSLRSLSAIDWRGFVEGLSRVERTLREDPAGIHRRMDFATRDQYRHVIEEVAKQCQLTEATVAIHALELARARCALLGPDHRESHIGFFLIDRGRPQLELRVRVRRGVVGGIGALLRRWPLTTYLGGIALLVMAITALAGWWLWLANIPGWALGLLLGLIALTASQCAVTIINWLVTILIKPVALARLDFERGIPADQRTLVVIPTLMRKPTDVESLLDGLEVRFLANPDANLDFALLTDFGDAKTEHLPTDQKLTDLAVRGIDELNQKYAHLRPDIFRLLHRPRKFNPGEGVWMGWERKRGKLEDLNELLLHEDRTHFSVITGDPARFSQYRFVITLDTDTQLPRDAARELVGTLAHPLNRACFSPDDGRITDGYAILQPRAAINLPSAGKSWFAKLFSGEPGIDPYSRAVSDVYQDLFGEGSFVGKGIYDPIAFHRALHGRFPDNHILSHDLIEGSLSRAGLVSDVLVFEDHPSRYGADVSRRQRWTRGDWQLLPWLMARVPTADGRKIRNPLSPLARWKLFDNLRRGLVAPALLGLFLASWLALPENGFLVPLVIGLVIAPVALGAITGLLRKPADIPLLMHLRLQRDALFGQLAQVLLGLVFLPFETVVTLEAILRTSWRMLVSRKRLLEWTTASDAERNTAAGFFGVYVAMWTAPALALAAAGFLYLIDPSHLNGALPLLVVWVLSPAVAWFISRPLAQRRDELDLRRRQFLGRIARKTWRYYETFIGPDDHWLPPDNYQEHPLGVVAHRTSPTNMGLGLLANLSAYDLGYAPLPRVMDRIEQSLATLGKLERYRGHFYNWYDTRTAKPIAPFYVSMVDSGNLAGHLLVLRQGLLDPIESPVLRPGLFAGLHHTFGLVVEHATVAQARAGGSTQGWMGRLGEFQKLWADLDRDLRQPPDGLSACLALLRRLITVSGDFVTNVATASDEELRWWAGAFEQECRDHRDHLEAIAPWSRLPPVPDVIFELPLDEGKHLDVLRTALARLDQSLTLDEIAGFHGTLLPQLDWFLDEYGQRNEPAVKTAIGWIASLRMQVSVAADRAEGFRKRLGIMATDAGRLAEMEWGFLFDRGRDLFAIGYNVTDSRLDGSYYDLLASEARLGSFVAIAQGQIPQDHWFTLGRLLTSTRAEPALLSWAGSMFEYLMPSLVMPTYSGTLLDQTCRAVVRRQIDYARSRGVPWGISESGYNLTDAHMNYQYRAFGVPGLGLKRGLADDLVIAPYASAMALMVMPAQACANLQRLATMGHEGQYGFYEAVDFTPARMPHGTNGAAVRSFMVHHQGMALLALDAVLCDQPMQRRFLADPLFKATELLLQERIPKSVPVVFPHAAEAGVDRVAAASPEATMRVFTNPTASQPEVHLLSNGRYHVLVTDAGGGVSRYKGAALTRWCEDATRDASGTFIYLRDIDRGSTWSAAWQPIGATPTSYEAVFLQGRAEFKRVDHDIETRTEIAVSPEDDIELRRVTLINRSRQTRVIELTSYAECVLAPADADASHPAFSKLFVQTRYEADKGALLCWRRPRRADEHPPWFVHLATVKGNEVGTASFDSARESFIGRNRSCANPLALETIGPLTGASGAVLDPIAALRRTVSLQPGESAIIDLVYGAADDEAGAIDLVARYRDRRLSDRIIGLGWSHSQVVLGQLGASEADAQIYGRLAGSVVFATPLRRAAANLLSANRSGQSGLWGFGISGDLPIVLLRLTDPARMELVKQLVNAHTYWRLKGLAVDLVIWNEDHSVYRQAVTERIVGHIAAGVGAGMLDKPGGIFVRRYDQMSEDDRTLFQAVARVVISDASGTLAQIVERRAKTEPPLPRLVPARGPGDPQSPTRRVPGDLRLFNGYGGFSPDGTEYVIALDENQTTPAPWSNVIANEQFGTVISESGAAYTWDGNCHERRLTPWIGDAVSDESGEALYLRDEDSGRVWSPTPWPIRSGSYTIRHGFGASVFEHQEAGIVSELTVFVPLDAPVKVCRLRLRNTTMRARRLTATGYVDWVLGSQRDRSSPFTVTEVDRRSGAILARNHYVNDGHGRIAFFAVSEPLRTVTGDRGEFIGRCGSLRQPAALSRTRLSGRTGAGLDPCAAMMVPLELPEGAERELVFLLGGGDSPEAIAALAQRFQGRAAVATALENVQAHWRRLLGTVQVETPEPMVDLLVNGWLLYQVQSCRLWGRSGFYQSGGAYGFRDQLQDVMALVHADPAAARAHLLRAAARQFREGDVQHWWHPPSGRGVRTRVSDDLLWLPFATARYLAITGDTSVLDEVVPFLDGRQLRDGEESWYDHPSIAEESGTLHEHNCRAIRRAQRVGAHGLPLMGGGDWNDGMNLVGVRGQGESVWLGFFLHQVLHHYGAVAHAHGDRSFAGECDGFAHRLRSALEEHGWDGAWYRRAWTDAGDVLGSADSTECRIDSLPQSWAVFTALGDPQRARTAMDSVTRLLVDPSVGIIRLFDPPFDQAALDPGYIKGYLPGVRENGGQYTHAAVWVVMATALLGEHDRAWELLRLINPLRHGATAGDIARWRIEPYVMPADVYGVAPHNGRGGWSWYTGSAGWMFRLISETLLGLERTGDQLRILPRLPTGWPGFRMRYRFGKTTWRIQVRIGEAARTQVDGIDKPDGVIPLIDDGIDHQVLVEVLRPQV